MDSSQKNVAIIGAGISGLSAGIFLQHNGFNTTIYELSKLPGGLCTSWRRSDYTFDFCIHWLSGSSPKNSFNKVWNEVMDFNSIQFHSMDNHIELAFLDGTQFKLYTNLERLKDYLLELAPEDQVIIKKMIKAMRAFQKVQAPVDRPMDRLNIVDYLKMLPSLPSLGALGKWAKWTNLDLAEKFTNPFLKKVFTKLFAGAAFSLLGIMYPIAMMDMGDSGYPIGGSLVFAKKMAERYQKLGGTIQYKSRVKKILVENGNASGLELENGTQVSADYVVSAADGYDTIFNMLEGKYVNKEIEDRFNHRPTFNSLIFISLGIDKPLTELNHMTTYELEKPLELVDGSKHSFITSHTYNFDPTLAPADKTMMNVMLETSNYQFWQELAKSDPVKYKSLKYEIADLVVSILDEKIGDLKQHIEIIDIATPNTIIRYTNNWKGSYEGWMFSAESFSGKGFSKTLPGLKRFYMCGQWVEPGGGLPPAVLSGRNIAYYICEAEKKRFRSPSES